MGLAPPTVPTCPTNPILIILIHVQTLIHLKPVAWSQQNLIQQNIHLIIILLTDTVTVMVMYPARQIIISTYLPEIFVNCLDILSPGIIRIRRLCHHTIREIYPIIPDIRLRNYFTILPVRDLIHINLTNDQFHFSIRRILSDRIRV